MLDKSGDIGQHSNQAHRTDRAFRDREVEGPDPNLEMETGDYSDARRPNQQPRGFMPHIDLPVFDGSKASEWLEHSNFYFNYYQTADMYKVGMATRCFTGDAEEWYSCYWVEHPNPTWQALVNVVF